MTEEELVKLIYDKFYDKERNTIDLSYLDFRPYNCNVDISFMKVNGKLSQYYQDVSGDLDQGNQKVGGDLEQGWQEVNGHLFQNNQTVKGHLEQHHQRAGELIFSDNCKEKLGDHVFDEEENWWKS